VSPDVTAMHPIDVDRLDTPVVVVAGKGGVGKTTVTALIARLAAGAGRRVLVIELDGKPALRALLPDLDVRHISAADALEEYLHEHGFRRIARRLASTGVIDVVSTAAPGIDDLVVLGKIKQLERSGSHDLIVVDGPAAGHAVTFLTSAAGLRDAVRNGPVGTQADEVLAMLSDPTRCQVVLVTVPETTPVNEMLDTAASLEARVGVRIGPLVINQLDAGDAVPDPAGVSFGRARLDVDDAVAAAEFRRARLASQDDEVERVRAAAGGDVWTVSSVPSAGLTASDIAELASGQRP
jgi:arsenite-transporting ATPase